MTDAKTNARNMPFFAGSLVGNGPLWKGRRPRGVPQILVMSAPEAAKMRPRSARGVIVAIRDPDTPPVPLNARWADVLRLELPDVSWDGQRDPTPESLASQARALIAFVEKNRRAPLIAFHCHAGVSRSRTTASVVCEHFGWPYDWYALHAPWQTALRTAFLVAEADAQFAQMQDPAVWQATTRGFEARLDRPSADDVMRTLIAGIPSIAVAFIFGSVARGDADARSDCDLFVMTEAGLSADAKWGVIKALAVRTVDASLALGCEVSPVVYQPEEIFRHLATYPGGFVERVLSEPKRFVLGSETALPRAQR